MDDQETNRLSKVMAKAGVDSRRHCEEIIFEGRVKVNGQVVKLPQTQVGPRDRITVDGKLLSQPENKVYYMLNKPKGYVCSNAPVGKSKKVLDLFPRVKLRLFTIGRLDKDTTGLLIVTNDGDFAQKVIHPASNIEKEYIATTSTTIERNHLAEITRGTRVEGSFVRPTSVILMNSHTVRIIIKEGKKREVRVIIEETGLEVVDLKRTRIGLH